MFSMFHTFQGDHPAKEGVCTLHLSSSFLISYSLFRNTSKIDLPFTCNLSVSFISSSSLPPVTGGTVLNVCLLYRNTASEGAGLSSGEQIG